MAVLVAATLIFGVSATAAGAQTPPTTPTTSAQPQVQPPDTNTFPIAAPAEVSFTDSWHACRDGCSRQHKGNDLLADEGSPVVAVESGTIVKVHNVDEGLGGITVWLRGESGVSYYYAHNSQNLVAEGDVVTRGQVIALVGHTGNARNTASHVHFQINLCGTLSSDEPCTVDPYPYLQRWSQGLVGGGADGVAWYQAGTGSWGRRTDTGSDLTPVAFGPAGVPDVLPLAGDWNGDGRDSVGLYQRSDATFHLLDDQGVEMAPVQFGTPGRSDVWPIAGDFDGDGRDTIGLYQQADATFTIMVDGGVRSAPLALGTAFRADALPVVGDWDGDGRDSVGVYQQADTTLLVVDDEGRPVDPTTVALPVVRPEGATAYDAFPVAGDWDGDGRDNVGILWRNTATMELPVPTLADPAATRAVTTDEAPDLLPVAGDWNGNDLVTIEDLRQIFGPLPDEAKVVEGLPAINAAMMRAGIFTPARKAAFLATLHNESGFRYDAVEMGNDRRFRGRGLIQLTGEGNYRAAGKFLDVDLVANPDLAVNGMVSPAIAAWYWTVSRNINMAADKLDMAAVNIAIGYAPSMRRDMTRCADFITGLRYFSGGAIPEGVNCARTAESRRLAVSGVVAAAASGRLLPGAPHGPSAPAASVPPDLSSVPPTFVPPSTSPAPAPVTPTTPPPTAPPATQPPGTEPPPTDLGSTTPPTDGSTSSTTAPPDTSSTTAPPDTSSSTTSASTTSGAAAADDTSSSSTSTSSTATVVPDSTTSTTLFESQY